MRPQFSNLHTQTPELRQVSVDISTLIIRIRKVHLGYLMRLKRCKPVQMKEEDSQGQDQFNHGAHIPKYHWLTAFGETVNVICIGRNLIPYKMCPTMLTVCRRWMCSLCMKELAEKFLDMATNKQAFLRSHTRGPRRENALEGDRSLSRSERLLKFSF